LFSNALNMCPARRVITRKMRAWLMALHSLIFMFTDRRWKNTYSCFKM
jgi:hypothetical protein